MKDKETNLSVDTPERQLLLDTLVLCIKEREDIYESFKDSMRVLRILNLIPTIEKCIDF